MRVSEMTFPIRWVDIDSYQHVGHQRYFDWMTEARAAWLMALSKRLQLNLLFQFVVVDVQCNYRQSLFYPGTVTLSQDLVALGNSSLTLNYQFWADSEQTELVATAAAKLVCIDATTKKSVAIPTIMRAVLQG